MSGQRAARAASSGGGLVQERPDDATTLLDLPGDHLTPASAGLRKQLLGDWADDPGRQRQIDRLAEAISDWVRPAGG